MNRHGSTATRLLTRPAAGALEEAWAASASSAGNNADVRHELPF